MLRTSVLVSPYCERLSSGASAAATAGSELHHVITLTSDTVARQRRASSWSDRLRAGSGADAEICRDSAGAGAEAGTGVGEKGGISKTSKLHHLGSRLQNCESSLTFLTQG
jgi:hypothetical protein